MTTSTLPGAVNPTSTAAPSAARSAWQQTLHELWQKQSRWSQQADRLKADGVGWRGWVFAASFLGVILSTVTPFLVSLLGGPKPAPNPWLVLGVTMVGPVLVAASTFLTHSLLGPKTEQQWVKARLLSEALKAEGYIYAAAAPPYSDPVAAPAQLAKKIAALVQEYGGPAALPDADLSRVSARPHDLLDLTGYVERRLKDQLKEHEKGAKKHASELGRWRLLTGALSLLAVVLGVIAGTKLVSINVWVAVVSTAIASATAYVHATRLEFLAASYAKTAERLDNLRIAFTASPPTGDAQARFILDCEAELAAQNRVWSDELTKKPPTPPPAVPVANGGR